MAKNILENNTYDSRAAGLLNSTVQIESPQRCMSIILQTMGPFESILLEAHQASNMMCKVTSHKSRIKTCAFLEEITTLNNEVFKDFVSDMAVEIRNLGNPTGKVAENIDTVK